MDPHFEFYIVDHVKNVVLEVAEGEVYWFFSYSSSQWWSNLLACIGCFSY